MANDANDIYHIYAPQDESADTEADRAIKDGNGDEIASTYAKLVEVDEIKEKLNTIEEGAQVNVLEHIFVGNTEQEIDNKTITLKPYAPVVDYDPEMTIGSLPSIGIFKGIGLQNGMIFYKGITALAGKISFTARNTLAKYSYTGKINNMTLSRFFEVAEVNMYAFDYNLTTKEDKSNKVTSLSEASTDTQYPSAKAVFDITDGISFQLLQHEDDHSNPHCVTKAQVGLGNVDNTSDLDKPNVIETTWSNLKALRDASQLVPGKFYRITDYMTTTAQSNTSSAGHQFDIIVLALSNNALSEAAYACLHEGDSYFANSKLKAWQIWYCIDNDTNRFAWADMTNGKGVIYRMIDEFNNDVPYDFKNILFTADGKYANAYTFSYTERNVIKDASLSGLSKSCYDNVMKEYIASNKQQLNFNVFYLTSTSFDCRFNTFGFGCYSNTFIAKNCYSNTLGNYCYNNSFGSDCYRNTFGHTCYNNTFGNTCYNNTFGTLCLSNTFGNSCYSNTFGTHCTNNTFGTNCLYNSFANYCQTNTFSNYCSRNSFDVGFRNNSFGTNCYRNTFGTNCLYNSFASFCQINTFGDSCTYNSFGNYCYANSFGDDCNYITFGDSSAVINYCQNNIFDNGCNYIYFNSADTDASPSNQLQNVHVHLGIKGSSSDIKTVAVDRNLAYSTDVYPIGSTEMFI